MSDPLEKMGHDDKRLLRDVGIFRSVSPTGLARLSALVRWQSYSPDQQILGHEDPTNDVFFISSGIVRITTYSVSGKEVTFRDLEPGAMFGELAAIDGLPRSATAFAKTEAVLAHVSAKAFLDILTQFPEVNLATLKYLSGLVRDLSERVFQFSTLAVNNRIRAELLRLAADVMQPDNSAVIFPAPTHAEIASRVNTHREAVTRELNELSSAGLITGTSKQITVNDMRTLSLLVHDGEH